MNAIDKQKKMPMYQQIKEMLADAIAREEYNEGGRLPTEHELCKMFDVSRITVVRAFELLEQSGLIYRVQGKGSFVCAKKIERDLENMKSLTVLLREQGYNPVTKVVSKEFIKATPKLNLQFNRPVDSKEDYVLIKRLRYIDGVPIGISKSITEVDFSAKLSIEAFEGSMYQLLQENYGPVFSADEVLSVSVAREDESELLGVPTGFPLFVTESVAYTKDSMPIEVSSSVFRGDKVKYKNRAHLASLDLVLQSESSKQDEKTDITENAG